MNIDKDRKLDKEEMKKLTIDFIKAVKEETDYNGNNCFKQQKLYNNVNKIRDRIGTIDHLLWELYLAEKLVEPASKEEIEMMFFEKAKLHIRYDKDEWIISKQDWNKIASALVGKVGKEKK